MARSIKPAYFSPVIIFSLFSLSGCDDSTAQLEQFADKLENEANISRAAISDVLSVCSGEYTTCTIENEDAVITYFLGHSSKGYYECSIKEIEANNVKWNISKSSIVYSVDYSHSSKDNCKIQSYNINEFKEFAVNPRTEYEQDVPVSINIKAIGTEKDGYSEVKVNAVVTFDRSSFTSSNMQELFTGKDTISDESVTILHLNNEIEYSSYNTQSGDMYLEKGSFSPTLYLLVKSSTAKEIFLNNW